MKSRYALPLWAKLYFVLMPMLIVGTSVARADGFSFDPSTVYPGELAFSYSAFVPDAGATSWLVVVEDTSTAGAEFYGYCYDHPAGPIYPGCNDGPVAAFEPAGAGPFDIATVIFGFDPGLVYPQVAAQPYVITTSEPSTFMMVLSGLILLYVICLWPHLRRKF